MWIVAIAVAIGAIAVCALLLNCATAKIRSRRQEMRKVENEMMMARTAALEDVLLNFEREEMSARVVGVPRLTDDAQYATRPPAALQPRDIAKRKRVATASLNRPSVASARHVAPRQDREHTYAEEPDHSEYPAEVLNDTSVGWERNDLTHPSASPPDLLSDDGDAANAELLLVFSPPRDERDELPEEKNLLHGSIGPVLRRSIPSAT